jgi:hypothetical protein
MDTIPIAVKPYYFDGKKAPDLVNGYQCVGFDADHCLVKFNIDGLFRLLIEGHLYELHHTLKYPKEVLDFDFDKNLKTVTNNTVWDIEKGNVLKLSGE